MRIAVMAPLVSPIAEPQLGGSQALLADLSRGLTERGHDVCVYAASGSRIDGVEVVDTGIDSTALGATLFRADGGSTPASDEIVVRAFARVATMVAAHRPDVVHQHAFDGPALDAAVGLGVSVVQVLHLPPAPRMAEAVRAARSAARSPAVVTVSNLMRAAWSGAGVDAEVIRNGVPVPDIPWSDRAGDEALFAGRLSPEKGALDAIEIARRAGVPLRIVGSPYDPDHAAEVERRAAIAGVAVDPALPRPALWRLMAAARAVLCPVHWDEPFGLVAAEAQAAGTPVVGYRRGALPEVVADGRTGVLVEEGDLDGAAAALADIGRLSRSECREHAATHLDLEDMISGYERVSERLVQPAGTTGGSS